MDEEAAVLFVDDPSVVGETATRLEAERPAFDVVTATHIGEALAILAERRIDCVVSNYEVPDENGLEFLGGLELLRSVRERDPDLPFILFTNIGNEDIAREAIAADVTDYILKWERGDSHTRLARRIESAVGRRRAEERAAEQARINAVIRAVNEVLVRGDEREAILDGVCAELTATGPYGAAQMGRFEDGDFVVEAAASDGLVVEPGSVPVPDDLGETVVTRAVAAAELRVSRSIAPDGLWGPVYDAGYRAVAALPVRYADERFGVLVVYAASPDDLDDAATTVLSELGESIAHAVDAVRTRTELERQNRRLEQFASIVSHDLRNPLSVARGYHEMLDASPAKEAIGESLDRMAAIVDDVLQLARQDRSPELHTVDVGAVARTAWSQVDTGDATLSVESVGPRQADESQLQRLFENLFRNSIEHGGDEVDVRVGPTDRGFYVADDGPGIPENERDAVFETGYTTTDDGTGFGLVIVEDVADVHGWSVTVEESDSGGARFVIESS